MFVFCCPLQVNPSMVAELESRGMKFVGHSEDGQRMEIMELDGMHTTFTLFSEYIYLYALIILFITEVLRCLPSPSLSLSFSFYGDISDLVKLLAMCNKQSTKFSVVHEVYFILLFLSCHPLWLYFRSMHPSRPLYCFFSLPHPQKILISLSMYQCKPPSPGLTHNCPHYNVSVIPSILDILPPPQITSQSVWSCAPLIISGQYTFPIPLQSSLVMHTFSHPTTSPNL